MSLDKQIAALQADLNAAHYVTYLTGAGVSTPSHIPDYRSKNGIYNGISESPEQMLNQISFIKKLPLVAIKMVF